ncbi:PucR family transcriptional regulator [Gryllotalpicola reticulitermitis]|uniref:PucR family transcriptional regulator n=1 Tax=Gryllotalpicola reticulitermitis TaxID=1184153 RepID=A0ABV8Q9E7_9MICO
MAANLRTLLGRPELELSLISEPSALPAGWDEHPIAWVHSSDLADPTLFLADGHVLLTTGGQFGDGRPTRAFARDYVERLIARGIIGVGFGTEVLRDGAPETFVDACARAGLPLFIVPYRIPFIAVAQANANELMVEATARANWALVAQRAIARAALRPDGLSATLAELSHRLGGWVALFDGAGGLQREFPAGSLTEGGDLDEVRAVAARMLRRGQRASATALEGDHAVALQTLGSGGQLRGVLALGPSEHLDQSGQEVVTAVIALASLALEQNHELDKARSMLRSGLLQLLQSGEHALVERIWGELWGPLPSEPFRAAAVSVTPDDLEQVAEFLNLWAGEQQDGLFFAQRGGMLVAFVPADGASPLPQLVAQFGARAGVSDPIGYADLPLALDQATQALRRSEEGTGGIIEFEEVARSGVLAYLTRSDTRAVARSVLAPLVEHDRDYGTDLMGSVRAWLENSCELDATARVLGIHRHTARARIAQVGATLGRDLSSFPARAELWAAFVAFE